MTHEEPEERTEMLQDVCHDEGLCLPYARDELLRDNVVMNEGGDVIYAPEFDSRSIELQRNRKELVLGLAGYETHTLEEANEILSTVGMVPKRSIRSRIRTILDENRARQA